MTSHTRKTRPYLGSHPPSQENMRYYDALVRLLNWAFRHRALVLFFVAMGVVVGWSTATVAQGDVTLESLAEQLAIQQGNLNVG